MTSADKVVEEKLRNSLLYFVDFLWAVVFGIIVAQLVEQVIMPSGPIIDKAGKILLIVGVFYFLCWDWLHGRLLTLRNPYKGYRRFFIEILIAGSGYGAARSALSGDPVFLLYTLSILLLGVWWAGVAISEWPQSTDAKELRFIQSYQLIVSPTVFFLYKIWKVNFEKPFEWQGSAVFMMIGYCFVLFYEVFNERSPGLLGGPGVPYLGRKAMVRIRSWLFNGKE